MGAKVSNQLEWVGGHRGGAKLTGRGLLIPTNSSEVIGMIKLSNHVLFCEERFSSFMTDYCSIICIMKL